MPVNYSKWDALELSDDSDIEVHPNVDKRSFIRAKQNQIHQDRYNRRNEIATLKYERRVNAGLLSRIDALLRTFRDHAAQAVGGNPDEFVMNAVMEVQMHGGAVEGKGGEAGKGPQKNKGGDQQGDADADDDEPPLPPPDIHYRTPKQPKYSEMLATLLDQVKKENAITGPDDHDWFAKYLAGIDAHRKKVGGLQDELDTRLTTLEKEEGSKITSDNIRTGFSSSSVAKAEAVAPVPAAPAQPAKKKDGGKKKQGKVEKVEMPLNNPAAIKRKELQRLESEGQTSGADADVDEGGSNQVHAAAAAAAAGLAGGKSPTAGEESDDEDDDEDEVDEESYEPSDLAKEFAKIKIGNYQQCLQFIGTHPQLLAEKETDGLLMEAFNAGMESKMEYAKQCVHQGLLLQYCRSLGKDGVGLFFKRITTPGHNAQKVFLEDVQTTYTRIASRTAELRQQAKSNPSTENVEQIQLHAVDPSTEILIRIPPAQPPTGTSTSITTPTDAAEAQPPQPTAEEQAALTHARTLFDSFPPGLQRAMESGQLDRINEVLGKMSVEEAEEVVEKMGEGGMLSMERGVIDGTTEEGKQRLRELEEEGKGKGKEVDAAGAEVENMD